jgi:Phage integrase, N-terminal SAM-like domain
VPTLNAFAPDFIAKHHEANLRKRSTITTANTILRRHLLPHLGDRCLDAITDEAVADLRAHWVKDTSSKKTINNRLSILSSLLHVAVEWRRIPAMPCTIKLLKVDDQQEAPF